MQLSRNTFAWLLVTFASMAASAQEYSSQRTNIQGCIQDASVFHKVNNTILEAILRVESKLNPNAVNKNANETLDYGIAGINSIHLGELSKWGIGPQELMRPCVGIYVAAWHLAKQTRKYGNTWFSVGAYNSVTPEKNYRYQTLVYQQVQLISRTKDLTISQQ